MQTPDEVSANFELISPIGYASSSRCGYCGNRGQSQSKRYSYYANATSLSPEFYQTLLDRCWRRSGKLLYRPDQRKSCCPHYTIRLDSREYKPTRDQRQTVNRFNKYILGDTYLKEVARLYPRSREETRTRDNEFHLIPRVHEAEYGVLKTPPEPAHKLVVTLEEDNFTEEKYQVYDNYQKVVHKDGPADRTPRAFKRFLCSSPLRRHEMTSTDGRRRRLGSYHQCYRIDGKLVAIGVLDLLPECVSSVYFLYHESIHKFAPGKLGALHEITLALEDGYRWWYPGFYIHNCPKMRYKIDYSPQYVLDPHGLSWDPLDDQILSLLDKKAFVSLALERQVIAQKHGVSTEAGHQMAKKSKLNDGASEGVSGGGNPVSSGDADEKDDHDEAEEEEDDDVSSLFLSNMPGVIPAADMAKVDLDHIPLKVFPTGPLFETSDLVAWDSKSITEWPGIKSSIAELIAAMGPDTTGSLCLDMSSRGQA